MSDTPETIAQKLTEARRAQPLWQNVSGKIRKEAIGRFGSLLRENTEALARTLSEETGKPIVQARAEIKATDGRIAFFLEHIDDAMQPQIVSRAGDSIEEQIIREPLGVIANISAWNYPYFIGTNVFVPALLTGNAVLYKPSEFASMTGQKIAQLLQQSGVPAGIFSLIEGEGDVGAKLLESEIDAVFFTGSYTTGKKIAATIGPRMIKMQLELGGKDPAYVREDADVEATACALAEGAFYNAGQSCCSVERIYVHARIADPFVARFVQEVESYVIGNPLDDKTFIGPLTRPSQIDVLQNQVDDAKSKGARVLCGGSRLARQGNYFAPTVVTNTNHQMLIMREESFGPVIGIQVAQDDDEALQMMQDTEYGLTASVYSRSREQSEKILRQLKVGTGYWNCCDRVSPRLPWTGRKHSGIGTTLSIEGIRTFTEPKALHLRKA